MKLSVPHIVVRGVLFVLLGIAAARAGIDAFTWRGVQVWLVLAAISVVDGLHEYCAVRRAYKAGVLRAVEVIFKKRWTK